MKPLILLDVDGPLTEGFVDLMCAVLRDEGFDHAFPWLVSHWDMDKCFSVPPEINEKVRKYLRGPNICYRFEPNAGARDFVTGLRNWARVVAVTSPLNGSPTWAHERELWLQNRLGFRDDEIISARDKTNVFGDVLVDDKATTVRSWATRWSSSEGILWNASYNAREMWNPRASSYTELEGLLAPLKERSK